MPKYQMQVYINEQELFKSSPSISFQRIDIAHDCNIFLMYSRPLSILMANPCRKIDENRKEKEIM